MQKWCLGCNFIVANTQLSLFIWKFLLHVCYVEVFYKITILITSELHSEIIPRSIGFYCPKGLPLTKNILQDATGEFKSLLDETYHSLLKRKREHYNNLKSRCNRGVYKYYGYIC